MRARRSDGAWPAPRILLVAVLALLLCSPVALATQSSASEGSQSDTATPLQTSLPEQPQPVLSESQSQPPQPPIPDQPQPVLPPQSSPSEPQQTAAPSAHADTVADAATDAATATDAPASATTIPSVATPASPPPPASDSDDSWTEARKAAMLERVREMFEHSYGGYMRDAFPHDELKPLSRSWTDSMAELGNAHASEPESYKNRAKQSSAGAGPGPNGIDSSKVYQGMALTLLDSLSTLAVMGQSERFCAGIAWLSAHLSFDLDVRVHVFETNIRVLGSLLSAHLLATHPERGPALTANVWYEPLLARTRTGAGVGEGKVEKVRFEYKGEMLRLAKDLGERLLRAFSPPRPPTPTPTPSPSAAGAGAGAAATSGAAQQPGSSGAAGAPSAAADAAAGGAAAAAGSSGSSSPLPYSFVHLQAGVLPGETEETCAACVGTLALEFGALTALTGDQRFWSAADAAVQALWTLRYAHTGLFPSSFTLRGSALDHTTGIGSSVDSLYEYLLKAGLLFDNKRYLDMFERALAGAERFLRVTALHPAEEAVPPLPAGAGAGAGAAAGAQQHRSQAHPHPHPQPQSRRRSVHPRPPPSSSYTPSTVQRTWYLEAHAPSGQGAAPPQFNALQAFWPGMLVLAGRVDLAREVYASFFSLWERFSAMPERVLFLSSPPALHPSERHYPLRPELAESTYALFRATGDAAYLSAGERMVSDLNRHARVREGGFADISNCDPAQLGPAGPGAMARSDRQQSFFLAETLKYLYLLFSPDSHWLHARGRAGGGEWLFSTEGHLFPVTHAMQRPPLSDDEAVYEVWRDWSAEAQAESEAGAEAGPAHGRVSDDLLAWDAKRRFDVRVAQVGRPAALRELDQAGPGANPLLLEVLAAGDALIPSPGRTAAASIAAGAGASAKPKAGHRFAHLFRWSDGLYHPALAARAADPRLYARESYYFSRLIGEETARGGLPDAALLPLGETPPPQPPAPAGSRPFTGRFVPSALEGPISVRDALLRPREGSTLCALQCPLHAHSRGYGGGGAPRSFMEYDGDWVRWKLQRRMHDERVAASERAAAARAATAAAQAAAAAAAQHQQQQHPHKPAGGAAQPGSLPQPQQQPQAFLNINGKHVPLPPDVLQFLTQHQQQQQQQQQQPPPPPVGGGISASSNAHIGDGLGDDEHSSSSAVMMGDFVVESEPGAFHVTHTPTGEVLTIRNLASDAVEVVNEHPEGPLSPSSPPQQGSSGSAGSAAAAPPPPPQRVQILTMDSEDYIHTLSIRVEVPGVCEGVLPAAGGLFGTAPPPASPSSRRANAPPANVFLDASARSDPAFDPQATLVRMGQARRAERGEVQAHIVRAEPALACEAVAPNSPQQKLFRGNFVLVERGGCTFLEKALNLQAAGAIGMVVWNRVEPNFLFLMGTDGTGRDVRFPVAMISEADGAFLSGCMAAQPQSRPLTVTIRRDSFQPGDQVPVPPLPVSAGQRRPAAASSAAAQSQSQRDLHVQLSGTIDHFSFKTMAGWTAQVDFDEKQRNYQLRLRLP